jgi:hypothetical protein
MNEIVFDVVTRRAAEVVSRRRSIIAMGGAALAAAISNPLETEAGKSGKKSKKRCKRQKQQCRSFYEGLCQGDPFCEERYFACCEFLASCNASAYLQCFHAAL